MADPIWWTKKQDVISFCILVHHIGSAIVNLKILSSYLKSAIPKARECQILRRFIAVRRLFLFQETICQ